MIFHIIELYVDLNQVLKRETHVQIIILSYSMFVFQTDYLGYNALEKFIIILLYEEALQNSKKRSYRRSFFIFTHTVYKINIYKSYV